MTLRESMRHSARLTVEHLQKERRVPDGAMPTSGAAQADRNEDDDFIFPRFDPAAAALAAASSAAASARTIPSEQISSSPAFKTHVDRNAPVGDTLEKQEQRLPHLTRDVSCHACGFLGVRYRCSRCGTARYCSARCQKKHWPEHKHVCAIAAQVAARMSPTDRALL